MKKDFLYVILVIAGLLFGCSKEYEITEPSLQVTIDKQTYKVGDTVRFHFDGNADFISFYSGEKKADYAFHNKERIYEANNILSFKSAKYSGINTECCQLKYSIDFNGQYDRESIRNATWINITDYFFIPPITGTSAVFSDSGELDIADLFPGDDTPIYFGWFFTTQASTLRTQFQVTEFKIVGEVLEDPSLSGVIYGYSDFNFKLILGEGFDLGNETPVPSINGTRIHWTGLNQNTTFKEGWAVSGPIYQTENVNLGLDKPEPIKIVSDPESASYQHIYNEAGEYTATFVIANSSVYGRKEVVKQIKVIVEP